MTNVKGSKGSKGSKGKATPTVETPTVETPTVELTGFRFGFANNELATAILAESRKVFQTSGIDATKTFLSKNGGFGLRLANSLGLPGTDADAGRTFAKDAGKFLGTGAELACAWLDAEAKGALNADGTLDVSSAIAWIQRNGKDKISNEFRDSPSSFVAGYVRTQVRRNVFLAYGDNGK